jgi:asparagine synthase (glutamine-hydrolysing)
MCGIAGIVGPGATQEAVARMTTAVAHRGPDGEGFWLENDVALGHRRLAIIDLDGGDQPMCSSSGRWVLVFNGEIYNYRLLREQVYPDYDYSNSSDSEAILAGLETEGAACLERLSGIFAFAAWDRESETLLLARDCMGVKPLYFGTANDGSFLFGSEVKALIAGGVQSKPDFDGLAVYLDVRFVPGARTVFEGVNKLAPGESLMVSRNGKVVAAEKFLATAPEIDRTIRRRDAVERVRQSMLDAVERQLVSDVPVGILLSGGVDSAAVAAAARIAQGSVTTYCVGYSGDHWSNEFTEAAETARILGTEHVELTIDEADAIAAMPKLVRHLEEPVVTTSVFSYFLLCEQVAKHRKVVLTGQGADEPWGGYNRHRAASLLPAMRRASRALPKGIIRKALGYDVSERLFDALAAEGDVATWRALHTLFPGESTDDVRPESEWIESRPALTDTLLEDYCPLLPANGGLFDRQLALDTRTSLPENLLMLADKLSMAHGLEVRVPLLDKDYLRVVESLPARLKRHGLLGGHGKYLHKLACLELLPRSIVYRRKKGFQTPIEEWLRGELGDHIEALAADSGSFARQWVGVDFVRKLVQRHRSRSSGNLERQLFAIWMLEEWARAFVVA